MKKNTKLCQQCKQLFSKPLTDSYSYFINRRKYCSSVCMAQAFKGKSVSPATQFKKGQLKGKLNHFWEGGKPYTTTQGYTCIWVDGQRRLEHRYVFEQHLGRKLLPTEHVHHLNSDKTDNRIENLVMINPTEHGFIHANQRWHSQSVKDI